MILPTPVVLPVNSRSLTTSAVENALVFIGTATVLIRYGGFTVLTDPNFLHFGQRVHLGYGLHATRRTEPALSLEQLPPLDLVVLSHLHEDHFDRLVAENLDHTLPIVTTPHATVLLQKKGFIAPKALPPWGHIDVHKGGARLRITAMPGRHGPALISALLPPVMGSMLEFDTGRGKPFRLYISGDTLVHRQLQEIPKRYPEIDVALLHLGGTRILGLLVTMDDKQGLRALQLIGAQVSIPIHYDDYTVFKSPLEAFQRAVDHAGLDGKVHYMRRGEMYRLGPLVAKPRELVLQRA